MFKTLDSHELACHIHIFVVVIFKEFNHMVSLIKKKNAFFSSLPEGLYSLFAIQIVSTLSFSVLYSTLVLYMTGTLGIQANTAHSVMGVFIAFNFGLHLLGGFWGGRLFSYPALFCVGMVCQMTGCILLSFGNVSLLYYALAGFLTGSGLNVTCINCMLTQCFKPEDSRREMAFLMNYSGMNIGFFIGFGLSGLFQLSQNYGLLFLISASSNLIALIICVCYWRQLWDRGTLFSKKDKASQTKSMVMGLLMILVLPFLLSQLLYNADWAKKIVLVIGLAMLGVIVYLAKKQPTKIAQDKILAFAVFMVIGTIFSMLFHIAPMGLTLFIEHNVLREFGTWIVPSQWFQNINTLSIVIGGPVLGFVLNKMRGAGIQINIPTQFAISLLCIGIAFVMLPIGIAYANNEGMISPWWIVLNYLLQSVGELLLSPIGYAMIGYLAPPSLQGMMMGMWMLTSGIGSILSSYSSNWMIEGKNSISPLVTNSGYSHVFLILSLFTLVASVVLFVLVPKLRTLIRETDKKELKTEAVNLPNQVVVCE
jgi:POT family proton-dependent oligopeptide transporter